MMPETLKTSCGKTLE